MLLGLGGAVRAEILGAAGEGGGAYGVVLQVDLHVWFGRFLEEGVGAVATEALVFGLGGAEVGLIEV